MEEDKEKKVDGRKNNGAVKGVYRGQGRPPKIKEKETNKLTLKKQHNPFAFCVVLPCLHPDLQKK